MKDDHILQFKITLEGIKPPIWRRIQVPCTYTMWDLHVAIQDAMGWEDYHLHEFELRRAGDRYLIGIPDDEGWSDEPTLPGWQLLAAEWFTLGERRARYVYDFGDDWEHRILLERIEPRDKSRTYPACIGGRRACPPEDVGGPAGYDHFLEILADADADRHAEMREWIGRPFDPAAFDPSAVVFTDPEERWRRAFLGGEEDDGLG